MSIKVEMDFDIDKKMQGLVDTFDLNQEDQDKIYTYFKWIWVSLNKLEMNKVTLQEAVFRTTGLAYVAALNKGKDKKDKE